MNLILKSIFRHVLPTAAIAILLATSIAAQTVSPIPSPGRHLPPPALFDESEEHPRLLELRSYNAAITIDGSIARTTLTLSFYNSGPRAVAGNLYVPLPPEATVCGYALDIRGVMVDGVVVPREQGRQVYQTVMARGIDPGIVEWTQGNVFKTRIFPVASHSARTVRISWVSPVVTQSDGKQSYVLPLAFKDPVAEFAVDIQVIKPDTRPLVASGPWKTLEFSNWKDGWRTSFSARDLKLDTDAVIELPAVARDPLAIETATDGVTSFAWFATATSLGATAAPPSKAPSNVTLYWDASASRADAGNDRIIKALKTATSAWTAKSGKLKVQLIVFRDRPEAAREFTLSSASDGGLFKYLDTIIYDGGTRFAGLPAPAGSSDLAILVSDGMDTLGSKTFVTKTALCILTAERHVNTGRLAGFAALTGGSLVTVDDPILAAERIGKPAFRLVEAKVLSGNATDIIQAAGTGVNLFGVCGHLDGNDAKILLRFGWGSTVTHEETITVTKKETVQNDVLRIFRAQSELAALLAAPDADSPAIKQRITDLGRANSLVSPGTSLIVLESLEQYVEFRIRPPATLPEIRTAWDNTMTEIDKSSKRMRADHLENVLTWWKERIEWWDTKYNVKPDYRYEQPHKTAEAEAAGAAPSVDFDRSESRSPTQVMTLNEAPQSRGVADDAKSKKDTNAGGSDSPPPPSIEIRPWSPDTPYIRELNRAAGGKEGGAVPTMNAATAEKTYARYLEIRKEWKASPAFFLDSGDFFERGGNHFYALRIWINLAEMDLENPGLLRILGYRLAQANELDLARVAFERLLEMRPEEPQAWRDLAEVCTAQADWTRAAELLWTIVALPDMNGPDGRPLVWQKTPQIEVIALNELNALLPKARAAGAKLPDIDKRFIKLLDTDIRIVLTWDTDLSDMDLWVIEPSGEKAFYGNRKSHIGGFVSNDITTGLGPEEYLIRKAMRGTYTIMANYYGNRNPEVSGWVTLQVELITDFGRPTEKRKALTLQLKGSAETYTVGTVNFGK